MDLIDSDTQRRLDAAGEGVDASRHLDVAVLEVGDWGILDVTVDQVHPARPFQRKRGGEGTVGRVTLRDASGAIDLVLWDDENRLTIDGPLCHATRLIIRGATVKAGWKGGLELGLGSAVLEPQAPPGTMRLEGTLLERGDAQVVGDPPRTKVEILVRLETGPVTVICWDDAIQAIQRPLGTAVTIEARAHPALDGYFIA